MNIANIHNYYFTDEHSHLQKCIDYVDTNNAASLSISKRAYSLVQNIQSAGDSMQAFMKQYNLSNNEGIMLMCLAEALLRISDKATIDELIKDKVGGSNWYQHIGVSDSMFVNASTVALMLTGKVVSIGHQDSPMAFLGKIIRKSGEPIIRKALMHAMRILGQQFVMERDIHKALKKSQEYTNRRYSFDMLGEAACTAKDAERYYQRYEDAIKAIGNHENPVHSPGISVKLSSLHPRYEFTKTERMFSELLPKIHNLCEIAKQQNIGLCIDAEEADRLDISLHIIEKLCCSEVLSGWNGLGFALQAYQKRACYIVDWAAQLAKKTKHKIMVRLVKGAYWDSEIKHAQEMGHSDYPVFTCKANTDVSYLACAKKLLQHPQYIYPCFATHNAHTLSYIIESIKNYDGDFEFQRLHGMGEALYAKVDYPCRVYAPVGGHEDLLSYLIRRLLENGANSSFINQIQTEESISEIIKDPIRSVKVKGCVRNDKIPLPINIFGTIRKNSKGVEMSNPIVSEELLNNMKKFDKPWLATPIIDGVSSKKNGLNEAYSPADLNSTVGKASFATAEDSLLALHIAYDSFPKWSKTEVKFRADCLEKIADLYEQNMERLMMILVKEAGKVLADAISEVREAVDFLRYYALQARKELSQWQRLPGVTGELNKINLFGRGVFLCIAPWNFPLAIFTGQVAAALVTGNTVLAKPSEQTSIIGFEAVKLMHEGGIPENVLHFLPGEGKVIGGALLSDKRIAGVAFTGSTGTANVINKQLASRQSAIAPLIAETGGINAMIVDSSALPEQVTKNVIESAFHSSGQRCSALRVLFLQEDIADKQIDMIVGAMKELEIGDPLQLSTDLGPIIDKEALSTLQSYVKDLDQNAKLLARLEVSSNLNGTFFAPCIYEISSISQLKEEAFGPILHIVRYKKSDLDKMIDEINATDYGLTFSVQSRISNNIEYISSKIRAGNIYVNRNQIGAVVESQPFGGSGLSGTGPKAGGARYLYRFCTEKVISIDTTASGGNTELLNL